MVFVVLFDLKFLIEFAASTWSRSPPRCRSAVYRCHACNGGQDRSGKPRLLDWRWSWSTASSSSPGRTAGAWPSAQPN